MGYEALIFLPEDCPIVIDELVENLYKALGRSCRIEVDGPEIRIKLDDWVINGVLLTGEAIHEKAVRLVTKHGATEHQKAVQSARYDRSFEIKCTPDPEMEYFNDYLFVVEAFAALKGALAVDTASMNFW